MAGRTTQLAVAAAMLLASVALSFYGFRSSRSQRSIRAGLRQFECTQAGDRSRYFLLHEVSSALGTAEMSCGYRYTVIASTQDTKGEYLKVQEYIRPGMPGTPQYMQRRSADMQFCTDICCAFLLIKPCDISYSIICSHDAPTS